MGARYVVRFVAPILYAAGFVPVLISTLVVLSLVDERLGFDNFTTFRYNGDVAAAATILILGGLVFGVVGRMLMWLERLRTPTVRDHLRHCSVLYVFMGTLSALLVATYERHAAHGVSLGYGLAALGYLTVVYAVLIDGLLLLYRFRRSNYAGSGDLA